MQARVGDRIVIRGHYAEAPERACEVLEIRGLDGAPPYLVRWEDDGLEMILYPGSDAVLQNYEHDRV